jgi:hypothetical protein
VVPFCCLIWAQVLLVTWNTGINWYNHLYMHQNIHTLACPRCRHQGDIGDLLTSDVYIFWCMSRWLYKLIILHSAMVHRILKWNTVVWDINCVDNQFAKWDVIACGLLANYQHWLIHRGCRAVALAQSMRKVKYLSKSFCWDLLKILLRGLV